MIIGPEIKYPGKIYPQVAHPEDLVVAEVKHPTTIYFEKKLWQLWEEAQKWQTQKARINELFRLISREDRIYQETFSFEDEVAIKQAMLTALTQGFQPGLRACYREETAQAPWVMGIKSEEDIKHFFSRNGNVSWRGTALHYRQWDADEVIVLYNPKGLGEKELESQHFVFRVDTFGNDLRVEMRLGTSQLRHIEGSVERKDLIHVERRVLPNGYTLGEPLSVSFGSSYLTEGTPQEEVLKTTNEVIRAVYHQWLQPPFSLYHRLKALGTFGISALEVQGRQSQEEVDWMLVYGLRGPAEGIIF